MPESVIREFNISPVSKIDSLGNAGGFSGSAIWKIHSNLQHYCLRRWPVDFDIDKLRWIHKVLAFAEINGCPEIICPVASNSGRTIVESNNSLWEMSPWVTGTADYLAHPNSQRLSSAISTIARFHQATARYHMNFAPSNNLTQVVNRLRNFKSALDTIQRDLRLDNGIISHGDWQFFQQYGPQIAGSLLNQLNPYVASTLPVQPVIRDIRSEHLFFEKDQVCAVIDFGAMQIDSVACDLSRMLGSLIADDSGEWRHAVDEYDTIRQLTDNERGLIVPLNKAGVVVGLLNWLDWVFAQRRQFESIDAVRSRVQYLLKRLKCFT